jgi:hypothetical protein
MFAKDFHLLNELYDQKIMKEMNLGPLGDNQGVTPSPTKITKVSLPPEKDCGCEDAENTACSYAAKGCDCNECEACKANQKSEDCEGYNPDDYDSNGKMARQLLFRVAKLSAMLHDLLQGKNNVEAWVLSKITNAHDQINSVFGYEDYEHALNPMQGECGDVAGSLEENNEEELFNAISRGGDSLVDMLRNSLKRESRETLEKVLLETIVLLESKK